MFAVGAEDVEGEASHSGEDAGIGSDTACVFEHGDIPDIMAAVFDAPVASDRLGCLVCADRRGRGIEGDISAQAPQAGFGVSDLSGSGDADEAFDEAAPGRADEGRFGVEDLDAAGLGAVALHGLFGLVSLQRGVRVGCAAQVLQEAGLVFLHLNKQVGLGAGGGLKCFFGSAWRRA